jgi:lysozyme family protein
MENLITLNNTRWNNCHIPAEKGSAFKAVSDRLTAPEAKARYEAVEKQTGVPWWFIAVVHEREASQKWNTQLGQGDPLNKKSVHVPKGRGPFKTWEEGAVDALVNCAPYPAKNKDWSIGGALTMLEKYNGLGYYRKGLPSPYVWAGTDQYVSGKYVADGKFDPNAVDKQLGCAGLLKFMGIYQKSSVPSVPVSTTTGNAPATTIAAGAAAGATAVYHYWSFFSDQWVLCTIGAIFAAIIVDILIHTYKNRKTYNV